MKANGAWHCPLCDEPLADPGQAHVKCPSDLLPGAYWKVPGRPDDQREQGPDGRTPSPNGPGAPLLDMETERAKQGPQKSTVGGSLNPKDACGIAKTPYSTISAPVMAEVGVAMMEGALKYGRHNYRITGVRASVYYDAVCARHMARWWEGEDLDTESGLHHVTKAIAGLTVLRDAMIQGKFIDDRPPKSPDGWQDVLDAKVKALLAKYPDPKPACIEDDR